LINPETRSGPFLSKAVNKSPDTARAVSHDESGDEQFVTDPLINAGTRYGPFLSAPLKKSPAAADRTVGAVMMADKKGAKKAKGKKKTEATAETKAEDKVEETDEAKAEEEKVELEILKKIEEEKVEVKVEKKVEAARAGEPALDYYGSSGNQDPYFSHPDTRYGPFLTQPVQNSPVSMEDTRYEPLPATQSWPQSDGGSSYGSMGDAGQFQTRYEDYLPPSSPDGARPYTARDDARYGPFLTQPVKAGSGGPRTASTESWPARQPVPQQLEGPASNRVPVSSYAQTPNNNSSDAANNFTRHPATRYGPFLTQPVKNSPDGRRTASMPDAQPAESRPDAGVESTYSDRYAVQSTKYLQRRPDVARRGVEDTYSDRYAVQNMVETRAGSGVPGSQMHSNHDVQPFSNPETRHGPFLTKPVANRPEGPRAVPTQPVSGAPDAPLPVSGVGNNYRPNNSSDAASSFSHPETRYGPFLTQPVQGPDFAATASTQPLQNRPEAARTAQPLQDGPDARSVSGEETQPWQKLQPDVPRTASVGDTRFGPFLTKPVQNRPDAPCTVNNHETRYGPFLTRPVQNFPDGTRTAYDDPDHPTQDPAGVLTPAGW